MSDVHDTQPRAAASEARDGWLTRLRHRARGWRLPGWHAWRRRLLPVELEGLFALAAAAGFGVLFLAIADEVGEGSAHRLDTALLLALRTPGDPSDPLGPAWLESAVRDITALGSYSVLGLVVLGVAGFLALAGWRAKAVEVIAFSLAGLLVSTLAKLGFGRPRPDLVAHAVEVASLSFPSGHALLSSVVYLTLGALVAATQPRRRVKAYVMGVAVLITLLVGASRIYLGVHWPSDVAAGWALGAALAAAFWLIARLASRWERP